MNNLMRLSGRRRLIPKGVALLSIPNAMTTGHPEFQEPVSAPCWYALRTFNRQEQHVSLFLEKQHLPHFIPMAYSSELQKPEEAGTDIADSPKPVLVPAVHNLLFVQKVGSQKEMLKTLSECVMPVSVFRNPGDRRPCEISERDILELRMLCDPQYKSSVFLSQGEAEAMVGKDVRVIAGPFKGAVGRLVRKHKQYYFLKAVIGMGVMVRISRWYCEPL